MNKFLFAAMLGSTLLGGPAYAQTQPTPDMQPMPPQAPRGGGMAGMMRADANHDGVLTRAEVVAQADMQFARLDTNGDGQIGPDEIAAIADAMHAMGGPGAPPPPPPPGAAPQGDTPPPPPPPGGMRGRHGMGGMGGGRILERADANGDGTISREEFRAQSLKRFDRLDANHDGSVTKDEIDAMLDMMPGMGKGMGKGHRGQGGDMPPPPPAPDAGQ